MLLQAFGLQRDPFLDTADPSFYYETMATASNRRRLFDSLAGGRGLAIVLGPVGAGKTSLFNAVTQRLLEDQRFVVGLILDPTFQSESELLEAIIAALGFPYNPALLNAGPRALREHLKRYLFDATAGDGRQAILLIDEAQLLPEALLESIRSLLNFQLDERKLLSIGLAGQAEIAEAIVRRPNLSDRVAVWLDVAPLTEPEAAGLIDHRLRCAGFAGDHSPFDAVVMREMWRRSSGLPRRLGALARESMEVAAERAARDVSTDDVEAAARRLPPARTAAPALEVIRPEITRQRPWWQLWKTAP
jgi:type II secretory pathway predicted ATPase ExeA